MKVFHQRLTRRLVYPFRNAEKRSDRSAMLSLRPPPLLLRSKLLLQEPRSSPAIASASVSNKPETEAAGAGGGVGAGADA